MAVAVDGFTGTYEWGHAWHVLTAHSQPARPFVYICQPEQRMMND